MARVPDTYDDDEENDDGGEVERPKTPPKPRESPPQGNPYEDQPEQPQVPPAGRGDNGGSTPFVAPMPDMPVMSDEPVMEPKLQQAMNDTQVADLFKSQRGARVIQMRPRKGMGDAPAIQQGPPTRAPANMDPKAIAAAQAAARAAQAAAAAQEAAKAAAEAQAVANRAAQTQQRIANEQGPVQTMQAQAPVDEPYRVPVKRRSSPFVLLGVAAAALFGAVAWSMMETYGPKKLEGTEDEEGEEEEELDAPSLSGHEDVIEGEIVEDEESDDDEQVA